MTKRKQASHQYQKREGTVPSLSFIDSSKGSIKTSSLIRPRTNAQRAYVDSIKSNTITLVQGQPGTGKSLLALHTAILLLNSELSPITKLFYVRSNVGMAEEKSIGFLPGSQLEKLGPLAYPVLDSLIEFMPEHQAKFLLESGRIEVLPIAMIRGRSFSNAMVLLDEAQNCTMHMLKTLLTRVGENSKMVLMGDPDQVDLSYGLKSGFMTILDKLQGLKDVGVLEFTVKDIQRHPIIQHILERL